MFSSTFWVQSIRISSRWCCSCWFVVVVWFGLGWGFFCLFVRLFLLFLVGEVGVVAFVFRFAFFFFCTITGTYIADRFIVFYYICGTAKPFNIAFLLACFFLNCLPLPPPPPPPPPPPSLPLAHPLSPTNRSFCNKVSWCLSFQYCETQGCTETAAAILSRMNTTADPCNVSDTCLFLLHVSYYILVVLSCACIIVLSYACINSLSSVGNVFVPCSFVVVS